MKTDELSQPSTCPFCGSSKIAAASGKVDAATYWRCEACGELWNLDRLHASSNRYNDRPRWT
ncbi:MAG: hypothetical protein A3G76_06190 [Acidobacteria bacterium RIFCSPLOWO2_12_FULL_65_11]|nr:MAG: hypothetical protein A3H95_05960 [Acidobacteria bacterium RIFCSPLOWO2_02_FULL_64_15]OFW32482.1 MAG: hypothetical protein A3G76_06190 [Acidobacteria bacterium RIFCSPLOWO2_12_FULL_65_11]